MSTFAKKPNQQDFREHLTTIGEDGKRKWIISKMPKGKIYNYRKWLSYIYYAVFFLLPFAKIKGQPVLMLNFVEQKFILFGSIFWPQDFIILGMITLAFLLFIYLFTLAYGRIFCGWMCPQTFFMEMMFRRIDYMVLGDSPKQKLLASKPLKGEKLTKYTIRYVLYFILAFIISNTFLAYIIGVEELMKIISEPLSEHFGGFLSIIGFSLVFFFVYVYLREQVCTNICPYGRLQSVLLNKKSIVVAYDYVRGEPRGKFTKKENSGLGDCIDCFQCVQVCPTGIDIRNGTQLECVNCTHCIDACDNMMIAVNRPTGLIRYASEENIEAGKPDTFNLRLKIYTLLMVALLGVVATLILTKKDYGGVILRQKGTLYQEKGTDSISNFFNIRLINKTQDEQIAELKLIGDNGQIQLIGTDKIKLNPETEIITPMFITLPKSAFKDRSHDVKVGVFVNGKNVRTLKTSLVGPLPENF